MPKITGYLAIGNGEPCPFCGVLLDSRPDHKGEDIQKHLFENHKKEMLKKLFPKRKEAQKNVFVRKPPKDKPIEKLFKKFLSEYLKNVMRILPQSYRSQQLIAGGVFAKAVLDFETKFLKEPFEEAINTFSEDKIIIQKSEWIGHFMKSHNIKTYQEAIDKLCECYRAWNKQIDLAEDYKLVKNEDLLTDKEIMCLAESMHFIKTKKVYPKGTGTKILKKLKVFTKGGKI